MRYIIITLLGLVAVSTALIAAEPAAEPAAVPAEQKPAVAATEAVPAAKDPSTDAKKAATVTAPADVAKRAVEDAATKGPSPQRFVPSEQVRADFDVSFPVDI